MKQWILAIAILFSVNLVADADHSKTDAAAESARKVFNLTPEKLQKLNSYIQNACTVLRDQATASTSPALGSHSTGSTGPSARPTAPSTTPAAGSGSRLADDGTVSPGDTASLVSSKCTACHGQKDPVAAARAIRDGSMPPPNNAKGITLSAEEKQSLLSILDK